MKRIKIRFVKPKSFIQKLYDIILCQDWREYIEYEAELFGAGHEGFEDMREWTEMKGAYIW